ncbi:MAG TPA: type I-U CRISPR-associated protein Cas8c [Rhizomicrobium sp.]|nr:type I-U CRISPR-associated protein Cas8c [Rhizomicrobium sp.]
MRLCDPDIVLEVDLRNPGQFFACCGALELAGRLWPGSEGWFAGKGSRATFHIATYSGHNDPLAEVVRCLQSCTIAGLTDEERRERKRLESEQRKLSKSGQELPEPLKQRREALGELARKGSVHLDAPFGLILDWWQYSYDGGDDSELKTWAGNQGPDGKINELRNTWRLKTYNVGSKLLAQRIPMQGRLGFDPSASWKAIDVGFSPDEQGVPVQTSPATEILAAVGLQRCRPAAVENKRRWFCYRPWHTPIDIAVAPAVIIGATQPRPVYEFQVVMRNQQYGSFGWAKPMEESR